jgi:hypothetical protein
MAGRGFGVPSKKVRIVARNRRGLGVDSVQGWRAAQAWGEFGVPVGRGAWEIHMDVCDADIWPSVVEVAH